MLVTLATCLLYLACFGFYHAGERRTAFDWLKTSEPARRWLRLGAWALAVVALFLLAQVQGWERGIPIWLGLLTLTGVASLLVSALVPRRHKLTAAGSAAGGLIAGVVLLWGAVA